MAHKPPTTPAIVARPTLIFLIFLAVGVVAWLLLPDIALSSTLVWVGRVLGVLLILGWLGLGVWSARAMQRAGTTAGLSTPSTALVQDGPYRISRNPIYLAIALLYLGISLLLGNLWGVLLLPVWLAITDWGVIRREELYLEARFGDAYRSYRVRVRRWL